MRRVFRFFKWLLLLLLAVGGGAYVWFWAAPVGINNYINKITVQFSIDSPELMTQLGAIDNTILDFHSGKLGDYTKAGEIETLEKIRKAREGLNKYGPDDLSGQELLSWQVTAWFFDDLIRQAEFEYSGYRVNQLSGVMVNLPQFLTDAHVIKNEKSVRRYIERLQEFGRVINEVIVRVEDDRDNGVVPPDFIIEKSLIGMRAFIDGGPGGNPLVTTLPEKLESIGLDEAGVNDYTAKAQAAVATHVIPGYEAMIAVFEELLTDSNSDAGIWRLPQGAAIYRAALRSSTTTDLTADDIHNTGIAEVARLELEMDEILQAQGLLEGSVAERVQQMMAMPEQQFPNTDEGREALLEYLNELNDDLMRKAGDFFITLPPQPLEIVRVPEYSQDSSPGGYYSPAALDGSRPGRFYINLKDTADNPKWTLPTLMYHEGAPGHHFQLSLAQRIEDVPLLRKVVPFNAYAEGWALYSERIAKTDMGMYELDPLGDLGRLQAEMFRAVRLVVDTGIHAKRWTREEAIDYMVSKTGMTTAEVTREIERYIVNPGQATGYKTGQLAILRLRERAERALGERFDIREFHETLLMNGSLPLEILEDVVDTWIAEQQ
ncbi:MAG: DUF885 domain-containing protein [Pseudomonadota bacterium]